MTTVLRKTRLTKTMWIALAAATLVIAAAAAIRTGALADTVATLAPAKQAILDKEAADRRASMLHSPVPPNPAANPTNHACCIEQPVAIPNWGLVGSGQVPFPSQGYSFVNRWNDKQGFSVAAGSLSSDPTIGVVSVMQFDSSRQMTSHAEYIAPRGSGVLRITGLSGTLLQLVSSTGHSWSFDLTEKAFTEQS